MYKLSLYRANVYYVCFSLSLVWVPFSAALSLDNFLNLGLRGGPLSMVGFGWTLECDRAACVACADPFIIPYCVSSSDVWSHGSASLSGVSLLDNWSLGVLILGIFFSAMGTNTEGIECILYISMRCNFYVCKIQDWYLPVDKHRRMNPGFLWLLGVCLL